ncbi:M60 family metallopeptidase [Aquisphaera insulae]|uniref:M60 family metallopeptidase n=1 Tax=Aquisphaera insulae TaxID=2712864 RepID=UPI0013EB438D|nr:M60 family metallopeptidase [Aquisphaera insulae]
MRIHCACALLLFVGVSSSEAQTRKPALGKNDRAQLIEEVREIAAPGAPGSLAVFSPTAGAAVGGGGEGNSQAVVVASGRLGKGRIVAFSHDGFFTAEQLQVADTARLLTNAMHWSAGGKSRPRVGLIHGHALQPLFEQQGATVGRPSLDDRFPGMDVLVLTPYELTAPQLQRLRAFVQAGGGLILGATGWASPLAGEQRMAEFAGNRLLDGSGLAWTDGMAEKTGPKGFKAGGDVAISPYVNAATALDLLKGSRKAEARDLACALGSVRQAFQVLPAGEPHFRAQVRKLLDARGRASLVPSRENPVRADDPSRRFAVGLETSLALSAPVQEVAASPAAAAFPGTVPKAAHRGEHAITIDLTPGWNSLGLYAAPGDRVTVTIPGDAVGLKLSAQIGSHTDSLWHLDSWERIPQVVRRFPITTETTTVANALGGLLYIDVPDHTPPRKLAVTVRHAVEAPLYRLGETTPDEWLTKQRKRPGPWAEIAGKNVIFTVPSIAVRGLNDPQSLMTLWDRMVAAQDEFVSHPRRDRPERIVADVQISAGYMHSGYPIMIPVDDSVPLELDEARLRKEGTWGHLHELGHNHQRGDWTFEGTGEVTNNLMVLYVFDKVLGLRFDSGHPDIRDRAKRDRRIKDFMAKGSSFEKWKEDPFLALMMYIQLYEAFGPAPFQAAFAEYAKLPDQERPRSDDEKRDQWLVRLSKAVGKNLGPFFRAWGMPTSEGARASVQSLPAWMPAGFEAPK